MPATPVVQAAVVTAPPPPPPPAVGRAHISDDELFADGLGEAEQAATESDPLDDGGDLEVTGESSEDDDERERRADEEEEEDGDVDQVVALF
jgi:hypothetical protein